jgi:hypothetical protein
MKGGMNAASPHSLVGAVVAALTLAGSAGCAFFSTSEGMESGSTTGSAAAATGAGGAMAATGTGGQMTAASAGGASTTAGGTGGVATGSGGTDTTGSGGTDTTGSGGMPATDCASIAPSAVSFDGHCYELVSEPATWNAARADCDGRGGYLVTISSEGRTEAEFLAENTFVWELGGGGERWIGANDGKSVGEAGDGTPYGWITGEEMTFDNWNEGQPNNYGPDATCQENMACSCDEGDWYEHCAFMWEMGAPGEWNDRLCEHVIAYVCEWDMPS